MQNSKGLQTLKRHLKPLGPPKSLFSGIRIEQSLAPDNIILFQRTDTEHFRPEGVSNNFHHRFELVVVVERGGAARIDGKTYALQPGECALIFPNQFHHFMDVETGHMDWLFITFELHHPEAIQSLRNSPRVLDEGCLTYLAEIAAEYTKASEADRDVLEISYLLSRLLIKLIRCPVLPAERQDIHSSDNVRDVILERINRYVRDHLHQAVTISDIAEELGYSISHLRAVFRDRLGVSLGRYMRESRLSEAAKLLQASDLNVSEIGERCGFDSLYAFSRAFRKAYGLPPRTYRNLIQSGAPLPLPDKPL